MSDLVFIDTETTGLDPRIHQPYEVAFWREHDPEPISAFLRHDLNLADPKALEIGGYWDRRADEALAESPAPTISRSTLFDALSGATLVGSNPGFDAAMLTRFLGTAVWHHRHINVAEGAMWVFGADRPMGLSDAANQCREQGFPIPRPDHTAVGDVRTTRAVYEALREIRGRVR